MIFLAKWDNNLILKKISWKPKLSKTLNSRSTNILSGLFSWGWANFCNPRFVLIWQENYPLAAGAFYSFLQIAGLHDIVSLKIWKNFQDQIIAK